MVTAMMEPLVDRTSDLSTIRNVMARLRPGLTDMHSVGLIDIAEMYRTRARAKAGRDCHAARDLLLTIACEWNLARDRLEEQSDACLAAIVDLLR
jgi:hypothetical protein